MTSKMQSAQGVVSVLIIQEVYPGHATVPSKSDPHNMVFSGYPVVPGAGYPVPDGMDASPHIRRSSHGV